MATTIKNRHPARNRISDLPNYFESKGEALTAIDSILNEYGIELAPRDCPGDEGSTTFDFFTFDNSYCLCDKCGESDDKGEFNNCLSFSWYKMQSGRWEIVAYIT